MKKIICFALIFVMLIPALAFAAEDAVAQPYDDTSIPDMSSNPYSTAFYGLWSNYVELESGNRNFCIYTPQGYFPWERLVMVLGPNGMTAEEFANESVWMDISEENAVAIAFLEPDESGEWGDIEKENEYINAVINRMAAQDVDAIKYASDGLYMVGYGEGATVSNNFGLSYPAFLAGLVTLGSDEIDPDFIDEIGSELCYVFSEKRDFTLDGYTNEKCLIPSWIINDANNNEALIEYLKEVNEVVDEGLQNEYATIYNQLHRSDNESRTDQAISRVWITDMDDAASSYTDHDFTSAIWTEFCYPLTRYLGLPYGDFREYYELEDLGFEVYSETMEHANLDVPIERRWAVYTPTSYDGSEPLPLVVATHGATGTYDMFAHNTEWWRVAEDRNVIVVFPQGTPRLIGHAGTARWFCGYLSLTQADELNTEAAMNSELEYFEKMLASVQENYNVDSTRIYATGHSNGSRMSYVLSEKMTDVFAATAMVGSSVQQFESLEEMPETDLVMPYLNLECEYENSNYDPDDPETALYWEMMYRLKRNGLSDPDPTIAPYTETDNGTYTMRTYRNDDGIPVAQYSKYDNACHAYFPDISYIVWDEFLCSYSRDAEGNSYYLGDLIEK